jgi:hypothetical protein
MQIKIQNQNLKKISDVKYKFHFNMIVSKIEIWIFSEFYNADNIFDLDLHFTKIHSYLKDWLFESELYNAVISIKFQF